MRVLCVAAAYPPYGKGGGPKGSENIARALSACGHTVRVITVADSEKLEVRNGIEVKTLRSLNVYWNYWVRRPAIAKLLWHALENFNPRALLRMRREIAAFQPDIVVTISIENVNVATWVAAWSRGCPSVHVIQSMFLMCWRGTMFSKNRNCERQCLQCRVASMGKKLCSRFVDGVTAEASHSLSLHGELGYFRHAATKVIPGAVAKPRLAPNFEVTSKGPLRIGYIGMLTPNKGVGTLAAAAELLSEDERFEYRIAGDGAPEFVRRVLSAFPASRTSYLGWVDPSSYYPSIDVLVVPSLSREAFGYVCLEALSYGVPAVVAKAGALPEIVEEGKSGLVFERGNHEALADCLKRIAGDRSLLSRLRAGAFARAAQYSPEVFAESLEGFLEAVRTNATRRIGGSRRHMRPKATQSPVS
jgi:glycosyltransferase involved in cell wall biosynthesis